MKPFLKDLLNFILLIGITISVLSALAGIAIASMKSDSLIINVLGIICYVIVLALALTLVKRKG